MYTVTAYHHSQHQPVVVNLLNEHFLALGSLGAFVAVGVFVSPDADYWYSQRFQSPSTDMDFGDAVECDRIRDALHTLCHALDTEACLKRPWFDNLSLPGGTVALRRVGAALIDALNFANRVTFKAEGK